MSAHLRLTMQRLRLVALVVGVGLLLGAVAGPSVATSSADRKAKATAPVTWNGWRGVKLGSALAAAHTRLGGTLHRTATSGGCGDVLTTRTGVLDGNSYARPHRVGNISVTRRVHYPLGIRFGMKPARAVALAEKSKYALHTRTTHDYGATQNENWVVGPHGHALYFIYTEGRIYRMGLAVNQRVARGQMELNGC
jgi:hypothetical protein